MRRATRLAATITAILALGGLGGCHAISGGLVDLGNGIRGLGEVVEGGRRGFEDALGIPEHKRQAGFDHKVADGGGR